MFILDCHLSKKKFVRFVSLFWHVSQIGKINLSIIIACTVKIKIITTPPTFSILTSYGIPFLYGKSTLFLANCQYPIYVSMSSFMLLAIIQ